MPPADAVPAPVAVPNPPPDHGEGLDPYALLEALTDTVMVLAPERDAGGAVISVRLLYANAAAVRELNAAAAKLQLPLGDGSLATPMQDLTRDAAARMEIVRRVLDSGGQEVRAAQQAASGRWFENTYAKFGANILVSGRDVTERLRAQEVLRASQTELEAVQRLGKVGSWTLELATGESVWSDGMWAIYGLARSAPRPTEAEYSQFFDPATVALRRDRIARAIATGEGYHEIVDIHRPDGTTGHLAVSGEVIRNADGVITGLRSFVVDITAVQQAEAANSRSQALFQAAFEQNPETISVVRPLLDEHGAFTDAEGLFVNRVGRERYFGDRPLDELVGHRLFERAPFLRPLLFDILAEVVATGAPVRRELHAERGGAEFWSDTWAFPFDGGIVTVGRDITEQRRAEAALHASDERWRFAVEASRDGLWDMDIPTQTVWYSRRWKSMLGMDDHEVGTSNDEWTIRVHPDDKAEAQEQFRRHLDGELPFYTSRHRLRHKDGSWVWTLSRGMVLVRDADGRPLRIVGTHTDLTELMEVQASLSQSEARYRALVEGVPGIVYSFSSQRGGLYYSPRATEILGYSPERLMAEPMLWHNAIHPDDLPAVDAGIAGAVMGQPIDVEYRIRDAWGEWRWLNDRSIASEESPGDIVIDGFALDITARKRAEAEREQLSAQLEQAQKLESIGRLAGGVAHDFNNMLGAIIGHADLALEGVGEDSLVRGNLEEIRSAANRSADLTRQLLAFARKQTVTPRVVNLNTSVTGQLAMLRRLIGEDINLVWHPAADVRPVRMDPSQLDQLLANLCVNARDAIDGLGRIEIATANATPAEMAARLEQVLPQGDYVRLTVSDDGAGMEPEVLERIFEPFFTTKRAGEGTGLGLATVHGIASQNHGWVTVASTPGRGSTFSVYLPAHAGADPGATEPDLPGRGGRGELILLVEDEPVILRLTAAMLTRLGYRVLTAASPGAALELAAAHAAEISLLITDVVMPEMNGQELVSALLDTWPNLPYLFISGYTADVIAQRGVLGEGIHFLQKPFTGATLATAVRKVLDAV